MLISLLDIKVFYFMFCIIEIDEDFKVQLKNFVESLLTPTNLKRKLVAGNLVTGYELMSHVRAYVSTINSGMLPEPKTMFTVSSNYAKI
jgi:hypothetical protein